jgi:hypothetical protein
MADRQIIRGDDYGVRRPLFRITLYTDTMAPFDLTGCTLRTTYKAAKTTPNADPNDTGAAIKHTLIINESGSATTQNGLYLIGLASGGVIEERLTATESRTLPLNTKLFSDVEITDSLGEKATFFSEGSLTAIDGYTNREV